jgi:hypothetical protein
MTARLQMEQKNKKARILVESGPLERVDGRCSYTSSNPGCARSSYAFVHGWTDCFELGRDAIRHPPIEAARVNATRPTIWVKLVVDAGRVLTMGSLVENWSCRFRQ